MWSLGKIFTRVSGSDINNNLCVWVEVFEFNEKKEIEINLYLGDFEIHLVIQKITVEI